MIRIPIELDQYGLGVKKTILGMLVIVNDGTSTNSNRGNYQVHMRSKTGKLLRSGFVTNHARKSLPVGTLVRKALEALKY